MSGGLTEPGVSQTSPSDLNCLPSGRAGVPSKGNQEGAPGSVSASMTCGDCGRSFDEVMDFLVPDAIWNYVMAGQEQTTLTVRKGLFDDRLMARSEGVGGVVCLACFDKRARSANLPYRSHLVLFGTGCWMGGDYDEGVPL